MKQEIKINAQPRVEPEICDFILESPIEGFGAYRFDSKEQAKGSAIAEELFNVDDITAVLVIGSTISVTQTGKKPWPVIGKEIGIAIRKAVTSGNTMIADNQKTRTGEEKNLSQKIKNLIDERVNPEIASHGGIIDLLDVKNKDIYIRMGGGCQGCAASAATLRQGVEELLRKEVPDLGQIIDTTDHEAGTNPYYS